MANNKHNSAFRPFARKDVTLAIEPHTAFNDGDNPLSAAHESFSRFSFALLKEGRAHTMNMRWMSDDGTAANVPNNYLAFTEMFEEVKGEHLKALNGNSNEAILKSALDKFWGKFIKRFGKKDEPTTVSVDENSLAFTLAFKSGNYTKGKTAVQVLKEDPEGKDHLQQQKKWLEENVEKYPANKQYIQAIEEALSLDDEALNNAQSSVKYVLYSSGYRTLSKTNKSGKKFTYKGEINFFPGLDYPTEVKIVNCYCDTKKEGELEFPVLDSAEDKSTATISLTWNETLRMVKEFDLYFTIKSTELYTRGIAESENAFNAASAATKPVANNTSDNTEKAKDTAKTSNSAKSEAKKENTTTSTPADTKKQEKANTEATEPTETKEPAKEEKNDLIDDVFFNVDKIVAFKNVYCTTFADVPIEDLDDTVPKYNVIFEETVINQVGRDNFEEMVKAVNEGLETENESWRFPVAYTVTEETIKGKTKEVYRVHHFIK